MTPALCLTGGTGKDAGHVAVSVKKTQVGGVERVTLVGWSMFKTRRRHVVTAGNAERWLAKVSRENTCEGLPGCHVLRLRGGYTEVGPMVTV